MSLAYINRIISGARHRGHQFDLTTKYLWDLFLKQNKRCIFTGRVLKFSPDICNKPQIQTASLDRIDSNKGYIKGNVQWSHKVVNVMKQGMVDAEFIGLCKEISKHRRRK